MVLRHRRCRARLAKAETRPAAEATRNSARSTAIPSVQLAMGWTKPRRGTPRFQSWTENALTRLKVLQWRGFARSGDEAKAAISILFSRIQAPRRTSVPKRL